MPKVRITQAPNSGTQRVRIKTGIPGANSSYGNQAVPEYQPDQMSSPGLEVGRTIKEVPRDEANIEAEAGESILLPDKGGLPAFFNIGGKRHLQGGTPLNVPKDSFVFSDTKKMRIKDPEILAEFGKAKGSYTPADLAKKYDINKFRKQLQDPDSDSIMISTAEKMIGNYNAKLGKLALVQESKKGFPQGIPAVAMPYMSKFNVKPDQILPLKAGQDQESFHEDQQEGQEEPQMQYGGYLPRAQNGLDWSKIPNYSESWKHPETQDFVAPQLHAYQEDPSVFQSLLYGTTVPSRLVQGAYNYDHADNSTMGQYLTKEGHPIIGAATDFALDPTTYIPAAKVLKGAKVVGQLGKEALVQLGEHAAVVIDAVKKYGPILAKLAGKIPEKAYTYLKNNPAELMKVAGLAKSTYVSSQSVDNPDRKFTPVVSPYIEHNSDYEDNSSFRMPGTYSLPQVGPPVVQPVIKPAVKDTSKNTKKAEEIFNY